MTASKDYYLYVYQYRISMEVQRDGESLHPTMRSNLLAPQMKVGTVKVDNLTAAVTA